MVGPLSAYAGIFSFLGALRGFSEPFLAQRPAVNSTFFLEAAMNLDPQDAQGGASISVVSGSSLVAVGVPVGIFLEDRYTSGQITLYTVREGDTLSDIATLFDVNVNTILSANDLSRGSVIKPGQTLIILPISGVQYVVKQGDTVSSIAKRFKADVNDITEFNQLGGVALVVGEKIVIPTTEIAVSAPAPSSVARVSSGPSVPGYFIRPIIGGIKTQGIHGYNGVDLASSCASDVLASASGNIIVARDSGWNGGYGSYVVIAHPNGTQTLYSHLRDVLVRSGNYVAQGQQLGTIGTSGRSTGCHLHFEVRGARNPF